MKQFQYIFFFKVLLGPWYLGAWHAVPQRCKFRSCLNPGAFLWLFIVGLHYFYARESSRSGHYITFIHILLMAPGFPAMIPTGIKVHLRVVETEVSQEESYPGWTARGLKFSILVQNCNWEKKYLQVGLLVSVLWWDTRTPECLIWNVSHAKVPIGWFSSKPLLSFPSWQLC